MEQGFKNDLLRINSPAAIKNLYDKYADKLLGYILPIVTDREMAEDCVVKIFADISSSKKTLRPNSFEGTWNRLMTIANEQIDALGQSAKECKSVVNNSAYIQSHKYLSQMTETQRLVFCGVYYHRKTTAALAVELNLPEQELRLRLKEAFMIIREVKDEN